MKFEQYITELFKSDIPLKVRDQGDLWQADFEIDGLKYTFSGELVNKVMHRWAVAFELKEMHGKPVHRSDKYSMTGTGNAAKVMAAVIKAFKLWMDKKLPNEFYFQAKETSKQKLYGRLSKYIEKMGFEKTRVGSKFIYKSTE